MIIGTICIIFGLIFGFYPIYYGLTLENFFLSESSVVAAVFIVGGIIMIQLDSYFGKKNS